MFSKIKRFVGVLLSVVHMFVASAEMNLELPFSKILNTPADEENLRVCYEIPTRRQPQSALCAEAARKMRELYDLNARLPLAICHGCVYGTAERQVESEMSLARDSIIFSLPLPSIANNSTFYSHLSRTINISLFLNPALAPRPGLEGDAREVDDNLHLKEINGLYKSYIGSLSDEASVFIPKLPISRLEPISRRGSVLVGESALEFQRNLNITRIWYFLKTLSEKCTVHLPRNAIEEAEEDKIELYLAVAR